MSHELLCFCNPAHKTKSGGLLLLRRSAPLTRRTVAYFCSGAHISVRGVVRDERVALIPDAFFAIRDGENCVRHFYVEVTKANPGKHRILKENEIVAKCETYLAFAPAFKQEHGSDFRVLFTFPTKSKMENLLTMLRERRQDGLNNRKFYCTVEGFANPLEAIWKTPKDAAARKLLGDRTTDARRGETPCAISEMLHN